MSGFVQALPVILKAEGGYVDDPDDRGGATNKGVTQKTYDAWRIIQHEPTRTVRLISDVEVETIYHERYWVASKCDALPWPISLCQFDAAVNHGVRRAVKMLQAAVGATADGVHGPLTQAAVDDMEPGVVVNAMLWVRMDFYYRISRGTQIKFLRGWLRRVLHLRKVVL